MLFFQYGGQKLCNWLIPVMWPHPAPAHPANTHPARSHPARWSIVWDIRNCTGVLEYIIEINFDARWKCVHNLFIIIGHKFSPAYLHCQFLYHTVTQASVSSFCLVPDNTKYNRQVSVHVHQQGKPNFGRDQKILHQLRRPWERPWPYLCRGQWRSAGFHSHTVYSLKRNKVIRCENYSWNFVKFHRLFNNLNCNRLLIF